MTATNLGPNVVRGLGKAPPNLPVKTKLERDVYNVLNKYRSYSYIITLAALDKTKAANPKSYRETTKLDNIILKTGGKAVNGKISEIVPMVDNLPDWIQQELKYFNEDSAGRFDLYINNLEIDTIPVSTPQTGTSLVTGFRFEVYEPYSVVGFIEALTAASRASGYINYLDAVFLLKIEFVGYPDDKEITEAVKIPNSTRFFPFRFSKVDVDFNQSGTVYRCEAFPSEGVAFGDAEGSVKEPIQLNGITVKQILTDLMTKLNNLTATEAKTVYKDIKDTQIDTYNIVFPSFEGTTINVAKDNIIAEKPLKKLYEDTAIYAFESIEETAKQTAYQQAASTGDQRTFVFYEPNKFALNFAPGTNIQSIIDGIIRDSEYWREQIDENTAALKADGDNVSFWRITANLKDKEYNPIRKRLAYDITYQVTIDKIHKSRVPGYKGIVFPDTNINIVREYNYLYTGQNVDITSLKINLDRLFYERFPLALGANDRIPAEKTSQPGDRPNVTISNPSEPGKTEPNLAPTTGVSSAIESRSPAAPGGPPNTDATSYLARESFSQIMASAYSMVKLDMEILGDPVFLMTAGIGNHLPEVSKDPAFTTDGEANFFAENVFIKIYFRNPTDIDDESLDKGGTGLAKFTSRYDFSGYYMLVKAISNFRNGMFTQRLELNRMQIQLSDSDYKAPNPNTTKFFGTEPKPEDKTRIDSGENSVVPADQRGSLSDLISGVNRFADNLANLEENITSAVQGAVEGVAGAVAGVVEAPVQFVGQVTNKIQGALQGINNVAVDAADKLNLTPSQLASLSPQQLLATIAVSKLLPDNVSAGSIEKRAIAVTKKNITTIPPASTEQNLSQPVNQEVKETKEEAAARKFAEDMEKQSLGI